MSKKIEERCCQVTRRQALKVGAGATAAGVLGLGVSPAKAAAGPGPGEVPSTGPGHVVSVHKPGMRGRVFPHAEAAKEMVDKAVMTLTGKKSVKDAYACFIRPDDKVGIKINCLGGKWASTTREVVDPIVDGVRAAGVPDENIMIFDQFGGNMRGCRFQWEERKGRLRVINHEVLGYESDWTRTEGGGRGKLAKTLLWATAVINVPTIKDHDGAGITCALKNMVMGCVERPAMMHKEMYTAIPHFYAHDAIRSRVKLIIADGSFCLYDGGPKNNPKANVAHEHVYATTDPVAMDTICHEVVAGYRAKKNMRTLAQVRRPVMHIELAEKLGLGVGTREKIRLEEVELAPYVK